MPGRGAQAQLAVHSVLQLTQRVSGLVAPPATSASRESSSALRVSRLRLSFLMSVRFMSVPPEEEVPRSLRTRTISRSPILGTFGCLLEIRYSPPMAADPLRKLPASWSDDPFRYGTRWTTVRLPNGKVVDQPIPLTPEDLLDPQLGDEIPKSDPHAQIVTTLFGLLTRHFAEDPNVVVFYDMKIVWDIPGLPGPSPDISV